MTGRIDADALTRVYCVTIEGEEHRVTGSADYCRRRATEARAEGKLVGDVERLEDVIARKTA